MMLCRWCLVAPSKIGRSNSFTVSHISLLPDVCLQVLFPSAYTNTADWLRGTAITNEGTLQSCISRLQNALNDSERLKAVASVVEASSPDCWTSAAAVAALHAATHCLKVTA